MPKVGIMAEVSAEVMDNVVLPAKAEKRFNKLVGLLLTAYYENDKVRSIIDGEVEVSHMEGLSTLQGQLLRASQSVNFMGMVGESIEMSLDSAKSDFDSVLESDSPTPKSTVSSLDFDNFRKEILSSQKSFMDDMRELLVSLVGTHQPVSESPEGVGVGVEEFSTLTEKTSSDISTTTSSTKETKPPLTESSVVSSPVVPPSSAFDSFEIEEVVGDYSSQNTSGDDILNNLLGGNNSFSFGGS